MDSQQTTEHSLETKNELPAIKKFCPVCKIRLENNQRFCYVCGSAAAVKRQMSRKKKKIIVAALISLISLAFVLFSSFYVFPTYIMPQINLRKAISAFEEQNYDVSIEYYEKSGLHNEGENNFQYNYSVAMAQYLAEDYKNAAQTFNKTGGFLDSKEKIYDCGIILKDKEDYTAAIDCFSLLSTKEANDNKAFCEGMVAYGKKDYSTAITKFVVAQTTVEKANEFLPQVYFEYGKSLFDKKEYTSAQTQFKKAGDYQDAATYVTACALMNAESILKKGELNNALGAYKNLPEDFSFKGISVSDRVESIENAESFLSICGKWSPTQNYIQSRNVYKRDGSWNSWYWDETFTDQSLEIFCYLNNDGTVTVKGSVTFYRCTNYSSLGAYCQASKTTKSFTISNVKKIPSSYAIDSNTTLKYSKGSFSIDYSVKDNYSTSFYNLYMSSVTFGKRISTK